MPILFAPRIRLWLVSPEASAGIQAMSSLGRTDYGISLRELKSLMKSYTLEAEVGMKVFEAEQKAACKTPTTSDIVAAGHAAVSAVTTARLEDVLVERE